MLRRPHYIAFFLLVLMGLVLLNLPQKATSRLKLAISSLFLPLVTLVSGANTAAETASDQVMPRKIVMAENERLKRENQQLRILMMQTSLLQAENNQLRQAVGWQKQTNWKMKVAQIIIRDPANWWQTLQINLGSQDGISTNMAVVTADGLVGRIEQVGPNRSRVVLVGDPGCKVAAMVEDIREEGVLAPGPSSVLDQSIFEMNYISRHALLKVGQKVVTSGKGGIFPKGITIGYVVDFRSVGFGLYQEARLKLAANLKQLDQVWILAE